MRKENKAEGGFCFCLFKIKMLENICIRLELILRERADREGEYKRKRKKRMLPGATASRGQKRKTEIIHPF